MVSNTKAARLNALLPRELYVLVLTLRRATACFMVTPKFL